MLGGGLRQTGRAVGPSRVAPAELRTCIEVRTGNSHLFGLSPKRVRRPEALSSFRFVTMIRLNSWECAGLRLLSTILAVFLAVSLAILPISMPQAAARNGAHHGALVEVTHSHDPSPGHFHGDSGECDPEALQLLAGCASPSQAEHGPAGDSCCNMSCHAFQLSNAPDFFERVSTGWSLDSTADEQVVGVISSRIDRPPRPV